MNPDGWRRWVTILAIAGTGLMGGVFFAYSTFTMSALRRLPGADGLRSMQQVNVSAERSAGLMVALLGTAAVCVALGVGAARNFGDRSSVLQVVAGVVYLLGVVVMTVAFHVPRNDALGLVDAAAPDAIERWRDYARVWTAGNHVRTLSGLAASVLYAISLGAE